jgi:hypothetical protein
MGNPAPRTHDASGVMTGRIECPVGDDCRGGTTLRDHKDFRGLGVQRCNRLGTNVIPGTTRYLLGCSCGQELVRSVVNNDIDTFARRPYYRVVTVRNL